MGEVVQLFAGKSWKLDIDPPPWGNRPSIFQHILQHQVPGGGLGPTECALPDEQALRERSKGPSWEAGALEGTMAHAGLVPEGDEDEEQHLLSALMAVLKRGDRNSVAELYRLLEKTSAFGADEALIQAFAEVRGPIRERLRPVAQWLATQAPDREAVKIGISLLGCVEKCEEEDRRILATLGQHDELTLYCAVAFRNLLGADAAPALFSLAKNVTGWGRIHLIDDLAEAPDEEIRGWLLREGYKNDIMYEFTAESCAVGGQLLQELRASEVDEALFDGATAMLHTLVGEDDPEPTFGDYEDGRQAALLYLRHAQARKQLNLRALHTIATLGVWARCGAAEADLAECAAIAAAILQRPEWPQVVHKALASADREEFEPALYVAKELHIDTWEPLQKWVKAGEPFATYHLFNTTDRARFEQALAVVMASLDLSQLATGPDPAIGDETSLHLQVSVVLNALMKWQWVGIPLVCASLAAAPERTRSEALAVLSAWGIEGRPAELERALQIAMKDEPSSMLRERMFRVLNGQALTTPVTDDAALYDEFDDSFDDDDIE